MTYTINYKSSNGENTNWLTSVGVNSISTLDYSGKIGESICLFTAYPNTGSLVFRVHTMNNNNEDSGKWLDEVKLKDKAEYDNNKTYAGISKTPIDGFAIKSDSFKLVYRVHLKKDKWLDWIMGYNIEDSLYGYAGEIGKEIDAIQIMPLPE